MTYIGDKSMTDKRERNQEDKNRAIPVGETIVRPSYFLHNIAKYFLISYNIGKYCIYRGK